MTSANDRRSIIADVRSICKANDIEAFLTGSWADGTNENGSDVDLITIDGEQSGEEIETIIKEHIPFDVEIDVYQYNLADLDNLLDYYDPMAFNHTSQMIPLNFDPQTVEGLSVPREIPNDATEHTEIVVDSDLKDASQKLQNVLLWKGYQLLLERGCRPVPPSELPLKIEHVSEEYAQIVREVIDCSEQMEQNELSVSEGILKLADLVASSQKIK